MKYSYISKNIYPSPILSTETNSMNIYPYIILDRLE